jgi:beta-glucosidase
VETAGADDFGSAAHRQVALAAAEESITLLKNQGETLPLAKTAKILVAGPAARSVGALHGCWSFTWQGNDEKWYPKSTLSIEGALREKLGDAAVLHRRGVDFDGKAVDVEATVADAANADAVILCLGEDAYAETPGDINELDLPAGQQELAKRLYATGKPVVLVLVEGRGRIIREIEPGAKAILLAYWPGSEGARAIASVLFGDTNPSGKLPFTYARHANNLLTYDRKYTSRIAEISAPGTSAINVATPQYEFGFGLSYTTFAFKNLRLSTPAFKGFERLTVSVDVTNTGQRAGQEVVDLYTRDLYASLTPPMQRLRAFQKVLIDPGQTKTVTFALSADDLAFVNDASQRVIEFGDFEVMVGGLKAGFRYER